ncbi:MAG TPA: tRNA (guanosine(37)-N1)-methyltransferase TrmD [Polyangiaceae bacterium]|nr:tRNA (guanosine(37)-N1)-methyltransferase TrmD [Polyangiaceae bacterium]
MQVAVVTLFPELFTEFARTSFVGRAVERGVLALHLEHLRTHGLGNHRSVDDTPYGGGSGMVMRPDSVVAAMDAAEGALGAHRRPRRILLSPQGRPFDQARARRLSEYPAFVLVCGRYEGFDERVRYFADEEISLGDFVLTGGEVAAMCVIESVVRLLPGVLGNEDSVREESFSPACGGLLEYPQFTRPASYRGFEVPEVLRSGDHEKVAAWRRREARARSRVRRPDLAPAPRGRR